MIHLEETDNQNVWSVGFLSVADEQQSFVENGETYQGETVEGIML